MYEYEINVFVEDELKLRHTIKRFYTLPIMGRYQLKDIELKKYKIISYDVINWDEVRC